MARQIMLGKIGVEPFLVPIGKRIDLQPTVLDLEPRQARARFRLEALAARNPCLNAFKRARQRFDLANRSEEHTSELQSLMRSSYAVFCFKKKKLPRCTHPTIQPSNRILNHY